MKSDFLITEDVINSLDIPEYLKKDFMEEVTLPMTYEYFMCYTDRIADEEDLIDITLVKKYKKYEFVHKRELYNNYEIGDLLSYIDIHLDIGSIEDEGDLINVLFEMKVPFFLNANDEVTYAVRFLNAQYYIIKFDSKDIFASYRDIINILPEATNEEKLNTQTYAVLNIT